MRPYDTIFLQRMHHGNYLGPKNMNVEWDHMGPQGSQMGIGVQCGHRVGMVEGQTLNPRYPSG